MLSDFEDRLNKLDQIIDNLKGRRDRFLAHSDEEFFTNLEKINCIYPLTFSDVEKLICYVDSFCNVMLSSIAKESYSCKSENADDLLKLLFQVKSRE